MQDLLLDTWQPRLSTRALGRGTCSMLPETDSTNVQLRQLAQSGAPHGSLCCADMQTAGKGRLGRAWHSPAGQGLWLSVLLRPNLSPAQAPLVTFLAAMAMARAVRETARIPCDIKWPNDLVSGGKKLCGILLEVSTDMEHINHLIVGTGLNVKRGAYPAELAHQATSIEDITTPPARGAILAAYLNALEALLDRLEQDGFDAIAEDYARQCVTVGSRVQVIGAESFTGVSEAIDDTGALLVRDDAGMLRRVLSGDVSVRGVMGYV